MCLFAVDFLLVSEFGGCYGHTFVFQLGHGNPLVGAAFAELLPFALFGLGPLTQISLDSLAAALNACSLC